jgi:Na+/H+ antiporter NhaD/arsenite permease-like protein
MSLLIIIVFIVGYFLIAFEHKIKIDKAASALVTGILTWTCYFFSQNDPHEPSHVLMHHIGDISGILFFILGAMIIVEQVKEFNGFSIITSKIKTKSKVSLLWTLGFITFFLSSILDNLTTAIVISSLLTALISEQKLRWIFSGIVIIAANAGGAWSPIGDVTTTMLWSKGQLPNVSSMMSHLFIPSLVSLIIPLLWYSKKLKGDFERPHLRKSTEEHLEAIPKWQRNLVFGIGMSGLIFVPIFKSITHYPPFMGMLLSLGALWFVVDILNSKKPAEERRRLSILHTLTKIELSSVLFFLGILLAVSSLQSIGHLGELANVLNQTFQGEAGVVVINTIIGLTSAVVDNVPLVAATQGMYEHMEGLYAPDSAFWQLLAFCAGTGGSILIIGSAAGVAIMGLQHIDFGWYLKKISLPALLGYLGGILTYMFFYFDF